MAEPHAPRMPCPVAGCEAERPPEHAMCATHWRKVPRGLQRMVYRTWRARSARGSGVAERRAHLQALEEAQAAVEGREAQELFNDPLAPRYADGEPIE